MVMMFLEMVVFPCLLVEDCGWHVPGALRFVMVAVFLVVVIVVLVVVLLVVMVVAVVEIVGVVFLPETTLGPEDAEWAWPIAKGNT